MARVNWTKENLALLKGYGKANDLAGAAQRFNCTENAVKIKYGRLKLIPASNIHTAKSKPITTTKVIPAFVTNPFKIEQIPFTGTRSTPEIVIMLAHQMLNIKADKLDSILIPYSVANSKNASGSIFQQAKNHIAKISKDELVYTIKSTFSGDAEKKYLSARIWRLK